MDKKIINLLKKLKTCVVNESLGYNDNYEILMNGVDLDYINKILAENDEDNPKWLTSFLDIDFMVTDELKDFKSIDEIKNHFEKRYFKLSDSEAKFILDKIKTRIT